MRQIIFALILIYCTQDARGQFQGLVVNEFSQGNSGFRDYIELVVVGTRTCTDSTADIRGWIFDDQNGWYGTVSSSQGHYRFKNDPNWSAVPFGSIILLYNAADKNASITLVDDPTDLNGDLSYIVPIASSYIEQFNAGPNNTSGSSYIYPGASTTAGYINSNNQWQFLMALNNNGGDVISLVSPANRSAAYFSISYGYTVNAGYQNPTVSIADVGGGKSAYLTSGNYSTAADWSITPVPANETPGLPNGGTNTSWIHSMRLGPPKITATPSALPVCFSSVNQTTTLSYSDTWNTPTTYSIIWNNLPANSFMDVFSLPLPAGSIPIWIPAGTIAATYTGHLTVSNSNGSSCEPQAFTVTITPQPVVSAGNYSPICINSSPVSLTGTPSGGSFSGTGVSGNSFIPSSPGTHSIYYTYSNANGCSNTATASIIVNPLPVINITPLSPSVCSNSNGIGLSAIGADSYTWSPATGLSTTTGSNTVANPATTTTYTVTGTDINGCSNTAAISVSVEQAPVTPVLNSIQPTCTLPTGTITVQSSLGLEYSIDGTVFQTSNMFSGLNPGTYTILARNNTGCQSSATVTIQQQPLTPAQPTVLITQPTCSVATGSISVTPASNNLNYSIDGLNYSNTNGVFTNLLPGTYALTAKNGDGCISLPVPITIDNATGNTSSSGMICIPEGASYNFNGQILSTTGNYSTIYPRPGQCDSVVNLYLLVSRTQRENFAGCRSFAYNGTTYLNSTSLRDTIKSSIAGCDSIYRIITITIHPEPLTRIVRCLPAGQSYTFNSQVLTSSGQYTGVFSSSNGCDSTVHLSLVITKNETVQLSGCDKILYNGMLYTSSTTIFDTLPSRITSCDSVIRTINISILPKPTISVSPNKNICRGDSVQLTASAADCPIGWLGIANNKSIKVSPQATTLYTVVATNNDGCTDTGYVTVTVDAFNGQLDVRPNPVVAGTTVQMYTSANTNYKVLSWMPFNTSGGKYKTLIADTSLTVKVVTQSASGCIDIDSVQIIVDPLGDVFIPTAFTPNGDGKNDLFTIAGGQFKSFELRIWNRWGEPVFISKERSKGWDGNFANKPQPSGAYVYVLIATLKSGREVQRQGTVTLIR